MMLDARYDNLKKRYRDPRLLPYFDMLYMEHGDKLSDEQIIEKMSDLEQNLKVRDANRERDSKIFDLSERCEKCAFQYMLGLGKPDADTMNKVTTIFYSTDEPEQLMLMSLMDLLVYGRNLKVI